MQYIIALESLLYSQLMNLSAHICIIRSPANNVRIGDIFLQGHNVVSKSDAFCSQTLTPAERGYAQIEKECFVSAWACKKFEMYLIGLESFVLESDHKPFIPLMNTKNTHNTPILLREYL